MKAGRPRNDDTANPVRGLAAYLDAHWDERVGVTNEEVSRILGYKSSNMPSMWRTGRAKVTLTKLPDLARLLGVTTGELFPLWLEQELYDKVDGEVALKEISPYVISDAEANLIDTVRSAMMTRKGKGKQPPSFNLDTDTIKAISFIVANPDRAKDFVG